MSDLLTTTSHGLYCPKGDFYIDPWRAVETAVITHSHSDHARAGSKHYFTAKRGASILRKRMRSDAVVNELEYGQTLEFRGVRVSLHPAGHVLGSSQVRVDDGREVWVVSGDYKLQTDPTCDGFEAVECDTFVTESTFALPVYRWREPSTVFAEINAWWRENRDAGRTSVFHAYSLGKTQRLLAGLDASIGPLAVHGAAMEMIEAYREAGVILPEVVKAGPESALFLKGGMIILPGSAKADWLSVLSPLSIGTASGWMQIRSGRRQGMDRGFVLSDHADWPGILKAVETSKAKRVLVTHGYVGTLVRYLRGIGLEAIALETAWESAETT